MTERNQSIDLLLYDNSLRQKRVKVTHLIATWRVFYTEVVSNFFIVLIFLDPGTRLQLPFGGLKHHLLFHDPQTQNYFFTPPSKKKFFITPCNKIEKLNTDSLWYVFFQVNLHYFKRKLQAYLVSIWSLLNRANKKCYHVKTMSIGFQCNSIDFLILYQFERIFWIDLKYINNILKKPFETKAKYRV